MGRIDFFLGVLLFVGGLPALTPGFIHAAIPESGFALTGSVYSDGDNQHIAQARVMLCDDGANPIEEMSTNDSGDFSFQGLRPGRYILRVQANGYQAAEVHVDLSFTSERGLTVTLQPLRRDTSAQAPGRQTISAHELAMPEAARNLLIAGKKKLYVENHAQSALRDFQCATAQAPTYYEAYYQTGMAYLALQNSPEAEKQFRRSLEISHKKYPDAEIALGTLLIRRNEITEGEALLRHGLAGNLYSWPGQLELGELELSRGHLETALAAAQTAAELAPQQPMVHRVLAVIHLRQQNYAALITDLDAYLQLDPDSPAGVRAKELRSEAERHLAVATATPVAVK